MNVPGWLAWTLRVVVLLSLLTVFWPAAIIWAALMVKQYRDNSRRATA